MREASEQFRAALASEWVLAQLQSRRHNITKDERKEEREDDDRHMAEVAIGGDSTLVGKSVRAARIADRFGLAVLGTYRAADTHLFRSRVPAAERLDVGDVLLVQGRSEGLVDLERTEGTMVLRDAFELPRTTKAPLALAITAAVVVLAAFKLVPIAIAALAGTIAMLASRLCTLRKHRPRIERGGYRARRGQHRAGPRAGGNRRRCVDRLHSRAWSQRCGTGIRRRRFDAVFDDV